LEPDPNYSQSGGKSLRFEITPLDDIFLMNRETDMQLTGHITADNLMGLEAYSKFRKTHKAQVLAHRQMRSVHLGDHITLQFESETTIRYQIQEMLRIEKIFEEEGIQQEIDAYAPLVPEGSNWKATMLIEYPDVNERKRELARLIGVEDRMFIEVEGHARVYAIADEDLEREGPAGEASEAGSGGGSQEAYHSQRCIYPEVH
jgi:hypothetical protein